MKVSLPRQVPPVDRLVVLPGYHRSGCASNFIMPHRRRTGRLLLEKQGKFDQSGQLVRRWATPTLSDYARTPVMYAGFLPRFNTKTGLDVVNRSRPAASAGNPGVSKADLMHSDTDEAET